MSKQEQAINYHIEGYNCSQAVLGVFAEELGLDKEVAMKLASAFGGGMRCGNVCGAVTGAMMAFGLKEGQAIGEDQETKAKMNAYAVEIQRRFKEKHQTILCKELLPYDITTPEGMEQIKAENLSRTRCDQLIADAVASVEDMLDTIS